MSLSKVIENIHRGTFELIEDNRQHRADLEAAALRFIETASAEDCLLINKAMISRVSTLTGCATELEDSACMIKRYIESEAS